MERVIYDEWKEDIDINREEWEALLRDSTVFKKEDLELLKLIYMSDEFMATASQLTGILGRSHHGPLNSQVGRLGKRIVKKLEIEAPRKKSGKGYNWFNVPFWGIQTPEGYYWILRPELKDAMDELMRESDIISISEISYPDEIDINGIDNLHEGAKEQVYVNRYERNRRARVLCIKHYQAKCCICNFNFEEVYGSIGKDIIHVHHLIPLNQIGSTYRVDPIKDLRPVCPNCHLILHQKNPPYSIDEVKDMIQSNLKSRGTAEDNFNSCLGSSARGTNFR